MTPQAGTVRWSVCLGLPREDAAEARTGKGQERFSAPRSELRAGQAGRARRGVWARAAAPATGGGTAGCQAWVGTQHGPGDSSLCGGT